MDASAWIAVIAAIVALATLYFIRTQATAAERQAGQVERQTELQQKLREDASQPYVWADIAGDEHQGFLLRLTVYNEGPTVARNVVVTFDPPLDTARPEIKLDPDVLLVLTRGIKSLAPRRQLTWLFASGPDFLGSDMAPQVMSIEVACDGPYGACAPSVYEFNASDMAMTADSPTGSLHQVKRAIQDLTKTLKAAQRQR